MRSKTKIVRRIVGACGLACAALLSARDARAQAPVDTSFTYQGQLRQSGTAVSGPCDFTFTLWDADTGGTQVGPQLVLSNAVLTRGLLTADLDFGPGSINGQGRWLQITDRAPT